MPIQPPKATSPFFRVLTQFEPKADEQPPDTLTLLLDIARHELMRMDGVDCYMPASSFSYEQAISPCVEGEVYTRSTNIKIDGIPMIGDASGRNQPTDVACRECSFIYSHSAPSHTDYQAITHILILQADEHILEIDVDSNEDYYRIYECKVGDIIQFNIDKPHALLATEYTELPFVGLSYDTYLSPTMPYVHPALNRKTVLPFFQRLVTMLLERRMV